MKKMENYKNFCMNKELVDNDNAFILICNILSCYLLLLLQCNIIELARLYKAMYS